MSDMELWRITQLHPELVAALDKVAHHELGTALGGPPPPTRERGAHPGPALAARRGRVAEMRGRLHPWHSRRLMRCRVLHIRPHMCMVRHISRDHPDPRTP